MVRDESEDRGGRLGRVGGPSGWFGTGWVCETDRGTSLRSGTGWGTLREVRNGSGDLLAGSRRVRGPSGWCGTSRGTLGMFVTGQGTHGEIRDGLGRCGTGRETLEKVLDGSVDPR